MATTKTRPLIPAGILTKVPAIGGQDGKGEDATVHVKLFLPASAWTWYVTEYDPTNRLCFGLVIGHYAELGSFSLTELEELRCPPPFRLPVERDRYFTQATVAACRAEHV